MSKLTEEIRRLSRKIDNIDQRVEKIEESQTEGGWKISGSPIIASPSFEMPKFKVGDRFIPHKPKDENEYPTWWRLMDRYDGKTMTVADITESGNLKIDIDGDYGWCFNPSWCTKVEESKFKKGDWVRSLITGTVGKVEDFYEEGNHSRYLLSTIDGKNFTSHKNLLEPYFPKEGECAYVHSNESEHDYITIFSRNENGYLYDKCSINLKTNVLYNSDISPLIRISLIRELRPATAEEKKLLDSKLAEKGLRFDGKEIIKDDTPKVGDFCIFWDNDPKKASCNILAKINYPRKSVNLNSTYPFITKFENFKHCVKFESEEQFRRIKEGKK